MDLDKALILIDVEVDIYTIDQDIVTHGNQGRCLLGPHDTGNLGCAQDIPFLGGTLLDGFERGRSHVDSGHGNRFTVSGGLFRDIHHSGAPGVVEMGQWHIILRSCSYP